MSNTSIQLKRAAVVTGLALGAFALSAIADWSNPSLPPTQGNVAAPINVGGGDANGIYSQQKTGLLTLANLAVTYMNIASGTPATPRGSVLTNDGNGNAYWAAASSGSCPRGSQSYSNPGSFTFTAPSGCTSVSVQVWGAGGGGSYMPFGQGGVPAGGGGGGGYSTGIVTVIPLTNYAVTVGAGGPMAALDNYGNGSGTTGGSSSFVGISATGGAGGNNVSSGDGVSSGAGGAGNNINGGTGRIDIYSHGSGGMGGGGGSGGCPGVVPGGGGDGSYNHGTGCAGASGRVTISWGN